MLKETLLLLKTRAARLFGPPPHSVKEAVLRAYQQRYGIRTLIETGTFRGDMVDAMKSTFERIYSIELNKEFFRKAKNRFAREGNIVILQGDSGEILPKLLDDLTEPALFWLDGHYSGGDTSRGESDTPISNELRTIFEHPIKNHVVLIDDARLFNGTNDYPTYAEVSKTADSYGYSSKKERDIIVLLPV